MLMNLRFPLYARLLLWFFLNLLVLAVAFYLVFTLQFRVGLNSLLTGRVGERVQAVSEVISSELRGNPHAAWADILRRFNSAYRMQFCLFRLDGTQVSGEPLQLPAEVLAKVVERRGPGDGMGWGPLQAAAPVGPKTLKWGSRSPGSCCTPQAPASIG